MFGHLGQACTKRSLPERPFDGPPCLEKEQSTFISTQDMGAALSARQHIWGLQHTHRLPLIWTTHSRTLVGSLIHNERKDDVDDFCYLHCWHNVESMERFTSWKWIHVRSERIIIISVFFVMRAMSCCWCHVWPGCERQQWAKVHAAQRTLRYKIYD